MDEITPLERTNRRLAGEQVDRAPNQMIFMAYAAHLIGSTYARFAQGYRVLVKAALRASEVFHLDWVSVISDPVREASAFGAVVHMPEDAVPHCDPLLTNLNEIDTLQDWDPWDKPRTADRLHAVELLQQRVSGYYPICGWVEGACAEAAMLRGVNEFLMDALLEPDQLAQLLAICNAQAIRFAQAQIEAGADWVGIGDAVCSLLSPHIYETVALPFEQSLIQAIHEAGALVKLHICGDTSKLLPMMNRTGADIIDVDWMVDFAEAVRVCGSAAVNGNIDPVSVYLQGTPSDVRGAVIQCLQAGDGRSLISAGCEIPPGTPPENLLAHYEALRGFNSAV